MLRSAGKITNNSELSYKMCTAYVICFSFPYFNTIRLVYILIHLYIHAHFQMHFAYKFIHTTVIFNKEI